jgi:UDP-N-acetylmuramyl pentapeptide synthase
MPCQCYEVQRVGSGLVNGDIAESGGDAQQLNGRVGQRKVQGNGVIDTGIGVIDDLK